jgi:hypothetical protein
MLQRSCRLIAPRLREPAARLTMILARRGRYRLPCSQYDGVATSFLQIDRCVISVGIAPANVNSIMRFEIFGDDKVLWQSGVMTQDAKRS